MTAAPGDAARTTAQIASVVPVRIPNAPVAGKFRYQPGDTLPGILVAP
jgi:hypothetical protein